MGGGTINIRVSSGMEPKDGKPVQCRERLEGTAQA